MTRNPTLVSRVLACFTVVFTYCCVEAQLLPPIRILPLGDSITFGSGAAGGYRAPLYQLLTNAGYNVDFVGTQTGNGIATLPDSDHEGHGGWRIDQIDSIILSVFDVIDDPDIILLLIGTNDYGQGYDTPNATNRLEGLVARMATNRPYAKIIVANLLVRGEPYNTQIQTTFNPFVPGICDRQYALGREVYFDDLRSAVPLSDMPDNLHPNALGYAKMATNWFGVITNFFSPLGSTNRPALARAIGLGGWTNVNVVFSKPVADNATNVSNYSLSSGLTISGAKLDAARRVVTLTTSRQTAGAAYTLTVSGVTDMTAAQNAIAPNSTKTFLASPIRGVFNNITEATNYTLVYSLDLPDSATWGNPPYTVTNRTGVGAFDRVAYYLELQQPNAELQYIWVSMDPFTTNLNQIGVPTVTSGANFQQPITNMNVLSTVSSIVTGTGMSGGNMEFWPINYTQTNAANVPNASSTAYDFGDLAQAGGYGSMQLHNSSAGQVLFALNHWGTSGGAIDLGIGSRPGTVDLDWTFANNASSYSVKTLQVLVRPLADTTPPVANYAVGQTNLTSVKIYFSEPLSDSATNAYNYELAGLTVYDAVLDPVTRSVVTLTTSPHAALTQYQIYFWDITDRAGNAIDGATAVTWTSAAQSGIFNNVAEAGDYALVYSLNIPTAASFNTTNVPYGVDLHSYVSNFTRIGYYLELQQPNGAVNFVWTTMDAFTNDAGKIGVPFGAAGAVFQQSLANLSVMSSVQGVTWVTNSNGGNIEFWPGNYSAPNAVNVPNASGTSYDWGDTLSTGNGHGSMQIHNNGASQVVFAFNNWGGSGNTGDVDLGIGSNNGTNADWTFSRNGSSYSTRLLQVYVLPATTPAPALLTAQPAGGNTVMLRFSQTLTDDAASLSHYALSGGLTITNAALDATKTVVTLTTTAQQPNTYYTVAVSGVQNRTSSHTAIAPNTSATFLTPAIARGGVYANVPEAANWTLLYSLQIPAITAYNSTGALYTVDNHFGVTNATRVAYYMELAQSGGATNWVWAAMDTFSPDAGKLGVPTAANGAFQQYVTNLTVLSSVQGLVLGTNMPNGFIEFWPWDYQQANQLNIPNASPNTFDFGDRVSVGTGGYGSMQVHNVDARQTVLAFNNFGGTGGGAVCLGIGNNTSTVDGDWTHVKNGSNYVVRNLQVFALTPADTTAPAIQSAVFSLDLNAIVITFTEPVADSAGLLGNYTLTNAAITSVVLSNNLRQVILFTSPLNTGSNYVVGISGIRDRSSGANLMSATNVSVTEATLPAQITANVPESSDYKLVYKLNLPVTNPGLNSTGTVYDIDNRAYVGAFSRVAYYLELATNGGPTNWIYVSVDPFTSDVNKIGVPDLPSGALFQQKLTNMNVLSSQGDIAVGNSIQTGNIEFWGHSYGVGTNAFISNGSNANYDWNDQTNMAYFGSEGYGSMQLHNYGAYGTGQVLFAYNNWGKVSGATADLGIGNRPGQAHVDWTTANNGGSYVLKNLYVLVRPSADTAGPVITRATPSSSRTNIVLNFNEALADSATNLANFSANNGVTVTAATLRSNLRDIVLTTTAQTPGTAYTLTVSGVTDRSTNRNAITLTNVNFTAPATPAVFGLVPESTNYLLAAYLAIPTVTPNYNINGITYNTDLRSSILQPFNRVAYYLEMATVAGGVTNWIYVSADAMTRMINRVGVPVLGTGAGFQQKLTNMTVQSSVAGIVTGAGISSGSIEAWPFNYGNTTNSGIPTGSSSAYDWNDSVTVATGNQYACLQLHNYSANSTGQVLFAFNHWGAGQTGNIDLGIGTQLASANMDWTFGANGAAYAVKNLYFLVQPTNPPAGGASAIVAPGFVSQPRARTNQLGENTTLTALASGTGPFRYQWRFNGSVLAGQTNSVLALTNLQVSNAGAYDVVASNSAGSVTSIVAIVAVNRSPVPGFHILVATQNQTVTFPLQKLLNRDSDPDNDVLAVASVSAASTNGAAVSLGSSAISYTPVTDYLGADAFAYVLTDGRGGAANGLVVVQVVTTNGPTLNVVTAPQLTGSNTFSVRFAGIPDYTYSVQTSTNVSGPWTTLTNIVAPSTGVFDVIDAISPPLPPQRYYRTQPATQ